MQVSISADVIYTLIQTLKNEGLNDSEIKKALPDYFLKKNSWLDNISKEAVFASTDELKHDKKGGFQFSFAGFAILLALAQSLI
jgi:hypothetical protein